MARYFRLPFAVNGDKNTLPDTTPNSVVSYDTGYSQDYQRNPADDNLARRVERNFFNQLMFDVTSTLQLYYQTGTPPFITSADNNGTAFGYGVGARVLFNNRLYESLVASNTAEPTNTTNWRQVDFPGLDARYAQRGNNLSDLSDEAAARSNLGLGTAATVNTGTGNTNVPTTAQADARYYQRATADGRFLQISNNLSDLGDAATARTNLGNVLTQTETDARYAQQSNNLSDLDNLVTALINLGISTANINSDGTIASMKGIFTGSARDSTGRYTVSLSQAASGFVFIATARGASASSANIATVFPSGNNLNVHTTAGGGRGVGDTIDASFYVSALPA